MDSKKEHGGKALLTIDKFHCLLCLLDCKHSHVIWRFTISFVR